MHATLFPSGDSFSYQDNKIIKLLNRNRLKKTVPLKSIRRYERHVYQLHIICKIKMAPHQNIKFYDLEIILQANKGFDNKSVTN